MRGRHVLAGLAVGLLVAAPVVGLGALLGVAESDAWGVVTSVAFVTAAVLWLAVLSVARR